MFSRRFPPLEPNRLTAAIDARRERGGGLIDLTVSNPTTAGFTYDPGLLHELARPGALVYEPQPFGLPIAREAVAADYARRGLEIDPAHIVLTASTSEAYAYLFKLLCDPGDAVLIPAPSYPLFEHLASLEHVEVVHYPLQYDGLWHVDVRAIGDRVTERTRAVLVVSPNNPTGSIIGREELGRLSELCASRNLALVGDEVFADYPIQPAPNRADSVLEAGAALTFSLGGLSKTAALPQMKLGWIAVGGPDPVVSTALVRLELMCDTYLSVGTPVQHALAVLLESTADVRRQIVERLHRNVRVLLRIGARYPACEVLHTEGGWYGVVRIPAIEPEERVILDLVTRDGVLVHPGYFFDFPHEAFLVVSLLAPPDAFDAGVGRMFERAQR